MLQPLHATNTMREPTYVHRTGLPHMPDRVKRSGTAQVDLVHGEYRQFSVAMGLQRALVALRVTNPLEKLYRY